MEELLQQGITITGKVTSSGETEGIPGVNVIIKGTTRGTVTDVDGVYSIEVPDRQAVIVFSSIGYESQEIVVGERQTIDVTLASSTTALEEVVVVGYGTQK
jgi:hypothetical protein